MDRRPIISNVVFLKINEYAETFNVAHSLNTPMCTFLHILRYTHWKINTMIFFFCSIYPFFFFYYYVIYILYILSPRTNDYYIYIYIYNRFIVESRVWEMFFLRSYMRTDIILRVRFIIADATPQYASCTSVINTRALYINIHYVYEFDFEFRYCCQPRNKSQ